MVDFSTPCIIEDMALAVSEFYMDLELKTIVGITKLNLKSNLDEMP